MRRRSDHSQSLEHLTRFGNPVLKDVAKGASISAISMKDNPFARQYRRLVGKGIKPSNARLTVARAIVTALWVMWCKGEPYIPEH